jgi:ribosome recycling factor
MLNEFESYVDKAVAQLKEDLKAIRTGRATTSLVENMVVEVYGGSTKMKLREVATITTDGPTTIVVAPFDPSTGAEIEKSIGLSPLGLTVKTQGDRILVLVPPMSEEQRIKMKKLVGQSVEDKKEHIRKKRDELRKKLKHSLDNKEIPEDEKYRLEKDLDKKTHEVMESIQEMKESKEREIMGE